MQILIADDEPRHRRGMLNLLQTLRPQWNILAARNGEEALVMAELRRPDIIFSDIRMPHMDGFEIIERLRQADKQVVIVLISAYADFQYAQRAVNQGAFAYILKPVDIEEFTLLLDKLDREVQSRRQDAQKSEQADYQTQALYENRVFSRWLLGLPVEPDANLSFRLQSLLHGEDSGWVAVIELRTGDTYTVQEQEEISENGSYWVERQLKNCLCCTLEGMPGRIGVIIPEWIANPAEALESICANISKEYGLECLAGVSACTGRLEANLSGAYHGALEALQLHFYDMKRHVSFRDAFPERLPVPYIPLKNKQRMIDAFRKGDREEVVASFRCTADLLEQQKPLPQLYKEELSLLLQRMLDEIAPRLERDGFQFLRRHIRSLENSRTAAGFAERSAALMGQMLRFCSLGAANRFEECIRYVREFSGRELNLADVAERFHYSPNHFSYLFKQQTGETYVRFLNRIRIENACELLRDTDLKIYEIAKRVGIPDDKYFHRLFKKIVGVSANEYRKMKG